MASQQPHTRRHSQFTIAYDLGLSQATVSNALNGKRQLVSPESYARVWAHALAVGYRGKGIAREATPAEIEIQQVGVMRGRIDLSADQMLIAAQWAMEEALAAHTIATTPLGAWNRPAEKLMRKLWRSGLPRPALVIFGEVPATCLATLKARTHRLLTVGCHYPQEAPAVLNHDEQSADLLLAHLAALGHKRVMWLGGGENSQSLVARMAAVATAATAHRLEFRADLGLAMAKASAPAGREGVRAMLQRSASAASDTRPTALVCSDARVARAAVDELARARIAVPDEVSVVAIDAASACADDLPVITSASSDPTKMGLAAAQQLLDFPFAASGHFRRIVLPAYLSVGKTSGSALTTTGGRPAASRSGLKRVA